MAPILVRITKYTVASNEGLIPSNTKFQKSALAAVNGGVRYGRVPPANQDESFLDPQSMTETNNM